MAPDFKATEIHVRFDNKSAINCESELDNASMVLHFFFGGELHTMNRPQNEIMLKTLKRFAATIKKKQTSNKKTKYKKNVSNNLKSPTKSLASPDDDTTRLVTKTFTSLTITNDDLSSPDALIRVTKPEGIHYTIINIECCLNSSFTTGMMVYIEGLTFTVIKNAPTITSISIFPKSNLTIGYPIIPTVTVEYADGINYEWVIMNNNSASVTDTLGYDIVCTDKVIIPNPSMVNGRIKLFCTAWRRLISTTDCNDVSHIPSFNSDTISSDQNYPHTRDSNVLFGRSATCYLNGIIECDNNEMKILDIRKDFNTCIRSLNQLRIVCYNILAEPFAISDYSKNHIYRYCPSEYLQTDYRVQRVIKELLAYDSEIICLQECDMKTFKNYLYPILLENGYLGHYTNKSSGVLEGCATFTKKSSFHVIRRLDLPIKNKLRNAHYLRSIYSLRPDLIDVLGGKLGTIGQITVLHHITPTNELSMRNHVMILANTHLFYHPVAEYVRLLQTDVIIQAVTTIRDYILLKFKQQYHQTSSNYSNNRNENTCETNLNENTSDFSDISSWLQDILKDFKYEGEEDQNQMVEEECMEKLTGSETIVTPSYLKKVSQDEENVIQSDSNQPIMTSLAVNVEENIYAKVDSNRNRNIISPVLEVSVVFVGDLNSTPETAVIEYLNQGIIQGDHVVWESVNNFRWGARDRDESVEVVDSLIDEGDKVVIKNESVSTNTALSRSNNSNTNADNSETVLNNISGGGFVYNNKPLSPGLENNEINTPYETFETPTLTHNLSLYSGAGLPKYTNYTGGFKDLLDYIYVDKNYHSVVRVAPFPNEKELSEHTGLPSKYYPSDHLAVVIDIEII